MSMASLFRWLPALIIFLAIGVRAGDSESDMSSGDDRSAFGIPDLVSSLLWGSGSSSAAFPLGVSTVSVVPASISTPNIQSVLPAAQSATAAVPGVLPTFVPTPVASSITQIFISTGATTSGGGGLLGGILSGIPSILSPVLNPSAGASNGGGSVIPLATSAAALGSLASNSPVGAPSISVPVPTTLVSNVAVVLSSLLQQGTIAAADIPQVAATLANVVPSLGSEIGSVLPALTSVVGELLGGAHSIIPEISSLANVVTSQVESVANDLLTHLVSSTVNVPVLSLALPTPTSLVGVLPAITISLPTEMASLVSNLGPITGVGNGMSELVSQLTALVGSQNSNFIGSLTGAIMASLTSAVPASVVNSLLNQATAIPLVSAATTVIHQCAQVTMTNNGFVCDSSVTVIAGSGSVAISSGSLSVIPTVPATASASATSTVSPGTAVSGSGPNGGSGAAGQSVALSGATTFTAGSGTQISSSSLAVSPPLSSISGSIATPPNSATFTASASLTKVSNPPSITPDSSQVPQGQAPDPGSTITEPPFRTSSSTFAAPSSSSISTALGPCPGQGYTCDDCPDGWFCPPQQTPAAPAPCGFGWPCVHCRGGWFCAPSLVPTTVTVYSKPTDPQTITVTATIPASPSQSTPLYAPITGWNYAGCFKDDAGRSLQNASITTAMAQGMNNEECIAYCKKQGFNLAGTEYGFQCFCGNALVDSWLIDDKLCNMSCSRGGAYPCGGSWAMNVWSPDGKAERIAGPELQYTPPVLSAGQTTIQIHPGGVRQRLVQMTSAIFAFPMAPPTHVSTTLVTTARPSSYHYGGGTKDIAMTFHDIVSAVLEQALAMGHKNSAPALSLPDRHWVGKRVTRSDQLDDDQATCLAACASSYLAGISLPSQHNSMSAYSSDLSTEAVETNTLSLSGATGTKVASGKSETLAGSITRGEETSNTRLFGRPTEPAPTLLDLGDAIQTSTGAKHFRLRRHPRGIVPKQ